MEFGLLSFLKLLLISYFLLTNVFFPNSNKKDKLNSNMSRNILNLYFQLTKLSVKCLLNSKTKLFFQFFIKKKKKETYNSIWRSFTLCFKFLHFIEHCLFKSFMMHNI